MSTFECNDWIIVQVTFFQYSNLFNVFLTIACYFSGYRGGGGGGGGGGYGGGGG